MVKISKNIPEPVVDYNRVIKLIGINFECLADAQIELISKLKIGMTQEEMLKIKKEIFTKYNIPTIEEWKDEELTHWRTMPRGIDGMD